MHYMEIQDLEELAHDGNCTIAPWATCRQL